MRIIQSAPRRAAGATSLKLPPEATVPERTFTPQVAKPGSQPISTDGQQDEGNAFPFSYRFCAYHNLAPTPHANGDVSLHIIRMVLVPDTDGRRTVFETDNFHVLVYHATTENDGLNWPQCDVLNWPHLRVRS